MRDGVYWLGIPLAISRLLLVTNIQADTNVKPGPELWKTKCDPVHLKKIFVSSEYTKDDCTGKSDFLPESSISTIVGAKYEDNWMVHWELESRMPTCQKYETSDSSLVCHNGKVVSYKIYWRGDHDGSAFTSSLERKYGMPIQTIPMFKLIGGESRNVGSAFIYEQSKNRVIYSEDHGSGLGGQFVIYISPKFLNEVRQTMDKATQRKLKNSLDKNNSEKARLPE